jgi:TonB family protein
MLAFAVLAGAVTTAQPPDKTVPVNDLAPIGLGAQFIQRPPASAYGAVYPHGAANVGMPGHVALDCGIETDGRLQNCKVEHETPEGVGFGGAALGLAHYFRLDPENATTAGGPFRFSVGFATVTNEEAQLAFGPWLAAPSFADTSAVYPDIGGGVTGQVFLHCGLERDGRLKGCKALYEHPVDREFDGAALKLAHFFQMRIDPAMLKSHEALSANVLVRIPAPFEDEAKQRQIADPVWLSAPGRDSLSRLFPAQAAAKAIVSGVGTVDCTVAADGTLVDCQADGSGDPPNLGFPEAALKAVVGMRMSPWTDNGGPVDGARIRLPIRFTSAAQ